MSELLAIREITKAELEDIENLGMEQIAERTEKVQDIYKVCTDFFVTPDESQQGLVQRLIFESIEQLGDIPQGCQYSIIGLGSLAFGTMTPWSDLEFAVLIKDEENKGREDEYREYFRNLTKLLWIKVINFGETPLSAVGVDSLNNYKTGEEQDNWFEDNITGKAFRFDPVYEDACKSALGRQGDYIVKKKFKNKDTGIEETKIIEKPNYDDAIECFNKALKIKKKIYSLTPHSQNITDSYKNLSLIFIKKEQYETALGYVFKADNNTLYTLVTILCGNKFLLEGNNEKARKWYAQIEEKYQASNAISQGFIELQLQYANIAYNSNLLLAAINIQKTLVSIDSNLQYSNHYHNLACFYACQSSTNEANNAFINALNHPNAKITGGLYAKYAQFLILNKDTLSIDSSTISKYLYAAIECNNIGRLQYSKIEKSMICSILHNIVKEQNTTITVNPKILAYYLLITNPEYIREDDSVENLLSSLKFICDNRQDEISFRLLADAYKFVGNEELSEESLIFSSMLSQVYKIVNKKLKFGDDDCTLTLLDVQKVAEAIDKSATQAILDKKLDDLSALYTKIFKIYSLILSDQIENLQTAANKLATISLLTNNIQQFINLKFKFGTELNLDIIKNLGKNIDHIIAIEQQIITKVIAEQKKHTAHATVTNKDAEDQIVSAGETEDTTDST